jgi:enoyl-CoA hydratase/carnithine racemase
MQSSSNETILVERRNGVGWITLNRPESINAFNNAMRREVQVALQQLDDDRQVRAIALRGAGDRGFCVGADLKEDRPAASAWASRSRPTSANWIQSFDHVSKPLIAVIHGYCLGGGLEMALACDIRLASSDAVFALPETGLGLIPGGGGTQRLPRIIGLGRALDLLIAGDRIDAAEAYRIGLVTRLSASAEALAKDATRFAERIAQRPPIATRLVKEAARLGAELEINAGLRLEKDLFSMLLATAERREAAAAFREKRAPVFDDE